MCDNTSSTSNKGLNEDGTLYDVNNYSTSDFIKVKENQTVRAKEIIGSVGTTGRSTGPHLHFTLTWYGVRVDPEPLFTHPQQAER